MKSCSGSKQADNGHWAQSNSTSHLLNYFHECMHGFHSMGSIPCVCKGVHGCMCVHVCAWVYVCMLMCVCVDWFAQSSMLLWDVQAHCSVLIARLTHCWVGWGKRSMALCVWVSMHGYMSAWECRGWNWLLHKHLSMNVTSLKAWVARWVWHDSGLFALARKVRNIHTLQ